MPTELKVSLETFNEIANGLEASGKKINKDEGITLTKDIAIKGPVDYRQTQIRKDVLACVGNVYKTKDATTDSTHFINFLEDVYNYVLKGEWPTAKPITETKAKPTTNDQPKASGWGTAKVNK